MPSNAARKVALTYRAQMAALRRRVLSYVERTWKGLPDYRDADIERFIAAVVPVVEGGQRTVASLTDAYLASYEAALLGKRVRPIGLDLAEFTTAAVRGTDPVEVYHRPGVEVWTALSRGDALDQAVAAGLQRALDLGATDLQLAKTHSSRSILRSKKNVVGYRRVLEGSKSCGLCIVTSTARYHKRDLLPIHPGCDCGVQPIYGESDPGWVIDPETLDQVHTRIEERFGGSTPDARGGNGIPDYRDVTLVRNHGEIGPVLGVRGQKFTGPSAVA